MTELDAAPFEKDRVLAGVQRAMDKVVDAAGSLGVRLPARLVVAAAAVPFDCEEVLAFCTTLRTGAPETRSGSGTYPNPGANITLYYVAVQLTIVRQTATLAGVPSSGVSTSPPNPDMYLTNLTGASGDAAVLLFAAAKLATEDVMGGTGAVPPQIAFSAPQGGLVATGCTAQVIV